MAIEKFKTLEQLLEQYPQIPKGQAEDLSNFKPVNNLIPICRVKKLCRPTWACQCKVCKNYKVVTAPQVKNKNKPGCCGNIVDLTGKRFGKLQVIKMLDKRRDRHTYWVCKCDCGKICEICGAELRSGDTQSCGCLRRENSSHGELKISRILTSANIPFSNQKQIKINKTYRYIDFCVKYNNIEYFIEYDGKQHFQQGCFSLKEAQSLEIIQRRDQQKNKYCKENNIPLIRIPYTHYKELSLDDLLLETSSFIV